MTPRTWSWAMWAEYRLRLATARRRCSRRVVAGFGQGKAMVTGELPAVDKASPASNLDTSLDSHPSSEALFDFVARLLLRLVVVPRCWMLLRPVAARSGCLLYGKASDRSGSAAADRLAAPNDCSQPELVARSCGAKAPHQAVMYMRHCPGTLATETITVPK